MLAAANTVSGVIVSLPRLKTYLAIEDAKMAGWGLSLSPLGWPSCPGASFLHGWRM